MSADATVQLRPILANPHYAAIGGEAAVRRLTERFYELMDELPRARAMPGWSA